MSSPTRVVSVVKEIEIKLRITEAPQVRDQLQRLGFEATGGRTFEDNWLFDFSNDPLRRSGSLLRLRLYGNQAIITFKDPAERNARYKVRDEVQVRVADSESVRQIFFKLGLRETFRYQKFRTEYHATGNARGHVLLDETPIGTFLELEGQPDWIDQIASQLGFSPRDYILKSYITLFLESGPEPGTSLRAMVFDPVRSEPRSESESNRES
jgi:adenylate cyclase class 2